MFEFLKKSKNRPAELPSFNGLDDESLAFRVKVLELRYAALEASVIELCYALRANLDRIDQNTQTLDKNMHDLAAMTLRPPTDLLGGNKEPN